MTSLFTLSDTTRCLPQEWRIKNQDGSNIQVSDPKWSRLNLAARTLSANYVEISKSVTLNNFEKFFTPSLSWNFMIEQKAEGGSIV